MTAPKAYLKRYDDDQLSNMTLVDNERVGDLASAEVMTNTSETIFGDNDSAHINEENTCTCEGSHKRTRLSGLYQSRVTKLREIHSSQ